tara:strand:- start:117 stop:353 length:237 start_codon:yes stop_codon:yes gene_type:complete
MATALETLKIKYIALTATEKRLLISELSVDEKLYLGNYMNDMDLSIAADSKEMDVERDVVFGNRTFEDGMEKFVNNKD